MDQTHSTLHRDAMDPADSEDTAFMIRDVQDRGVLMLCDPRLSTKNYRKQFLQSLPPMGSTGKLEDVAAFFAAGEA